MFKAHDENLQVNGGVENANVGRIEVENTANQYRPESINNAGRKSLFLNNIFNVSGSAQVEAAIQALSSYEKSVSSAKKMNIEFLPVDKESQFKGLKYSSVVATYKEGNNVYFLTIVLTGTGRDALTAQEYHAAVLNSHKGGFGSTEVYTFSDAYDADVEAAVMNVITNRYGAGINMINCDHILLKQSLENEQIKAELFNNIENSFLLAKSGRDNGILLPEISKEIAGKARFVMNCTSLPADDYDRLYNIQAANFMVDFGIESLINENSGQIGLNKLSFDGIIIRSSGMITVQPVTMQDIIDGQAITRLEYQPHIILTNITTQVPDVSSQVLAIAVAGLLSRKEYWAKLMIENADRLRLGALNYVVKRVETKKGEFGEVNFNAIDGLDKKLIMLDTLIKGNPIVSVDVTAGLCNNNLNSLTFLDTANADPMIIENANKEFEAGIQALIGGRINYTGSKTVSKVTLPYGYSVTNKGEREDLRNLTYTYILSAVNGDDETAANTMLDTMSPNSVTAFSSAIEIAKHFKPSAKIEGKLSRVTFNNNFVQILGGAVVQAIGGNLDLRGTVQLPQTTNHDFSVFNQNGINIGGINNKLYGNGFNNQFNYNLWNQYGQAGTRFM